MAKVHARFLYLNMSICEKNLIIDISKYTKNIKYLLVYQGFIRFFSLMQILDKYLGFLKNR